MLPGVKGSVGLAKMVGYILPPEARPGLADAPVPFDCMDQTMFELTYALVFVVQL